MVRGNHHVQILVTGDEKAVVSAEEEGRAMEKRLDVKVE